MRYLVTHKAKDTDVRLTFNCTFAPGGVIHNSAVEVSVGEVIKNGAQFICMNADTDAMKEKYPYSGDLHMGERIYHFTHWEFCADNSIILCI